MLIRSIGRSGVAALTLLFLLFSGPLVAQLNTWLVRSTSGVVRTLDLSQPVPVVGPPLVGIGTGGQEDVNVMTDAIGNILFSTVVDGSHDITVYDANFTPMPNGTGLQGNLSGLESCITPVPCHPDRFYVVHWVFPPVTGELRYSEVDLSLNGGLGDVTAVKNVLIGSGYTEGMAVTRQNSKGCRWLFACRKSPGLFEVTRSLINDVGIGPPVVVASVPMNGGAVTYTEIELTSAMDRLALSTPGTDPSDPDIVEWDLDLENGTLSNQSPRSVSNDPIFGIEYSPADQWLYFQGNSTNPDMDFGRLNTTTQVVEIITTSMGPFRRSLEEGGNGRIYSGGEYMNDFLAEVAFPDAPLLANIGWDPNAILVNNGGMRPGLPNAIENEVPGTAVTPGYIAFSGQAISGCDVWQFQDSTCLGTWWEWDLGDGTISPDPMPVHQYAPGTYDVTLRVVACGDTLTLTKPGYVTVNTVLPTAAAGALVDSTCAGIPVQFTNASLDATSYAWDLGDGSQAQLAEPLHVYAQAGNYEAQLVASNSCGSDTAEVSVVVLGTQAQALVLDDPCSTEILVLDQSAGAGSILWLFGDGGSSTDTSTTHDYGAPGSWSVQLITDPGTQCSDTVSVPVTVGVGPTAAFNASVLCDLEVDLQDASTGAVLWEWDLGDGSVSSMQDLLHAYAVAGVYPIVLVVTDSLGCMDTASTVVSPFLSALADIDVTTGPCEPLQVLDGSGSSASALYWDLGDGSLDSSFVVQHTYAVPGNYLVTLVADPGSPCADTSTVVVEWSGAPVAMIADSMGCQLEVFLDGYAPGVSSWSWDLGDGNASALPLVGHAYATPGSYTVVLVVSNALGCSDTAMAQLDVPSPVMASISSSYDACSGVWSFQDMSSGASSLIWVFGDGVIATSPDPEHVFQPGQHQVILIATDLAGCTDTASAIVQSMLATEDLGPYVPNVFTPNGDGINDAFHPLEGWSCSTFMLMVFNRWGELLFEGDASRGWDGTRSGVLVPDGVYPYLLKGEGTQWRGHVTLLR